MKTQASRPRVLLVAPLIPAETGNGLAMRAGVALEALAQFAEVHLLVLPLAPSPAGAEAFARCRAASITIEPIGDDPLALGDDPARVAARMIAWPAPLLCRFAEAQLRASIARHVAAIGLGLIHVMRLYLAPYLADALAASTAPAVLDLDEDDAAAQARLAELHARRGDLMGVQVASREASRFAALRAQINDRFARLLVASGTDADRLGGDRITVWPNVVRPSTPAPLPADGPLLFVATLGYPPNEEAVLHLAHHIVPRLRAVRPSLAVRVVGPGASPALRKAAAAAGIDIAGAVADLAGDYARASLVVIPLLAGGGTRIKLLEALAQARPVVSTTLGAEGIAVSHDEHLLLADTPADFATACLSLLEDRQRATRLAASGQALVARHYTLDCATAQLSGIYRTLYAATGEGTGA